MSVFNNIPAFNGFGKASLKLDFDTRDELNEYCARMLEASTPDDGGDDPEPERGHRYLIHSVKGLNAPGDVYIITDTRTKPRKELEETAAFKKFDIRPFDGSEFAADGSVVWFPVKDLNFDRANFQNREDDYSQDSVDKIIKAVKKGDFNWAVFDAVTIWQNPADGKFYVLSGHSRSEAFKRLAAQNATAGGKDFKRIPAKIFKGTLQEARQLALNSNTLSTKETNFERANYWRDVYERELEKQGGNRKAAENVVIQQIKETEGKNANSVFYISFLNKNGIFYDALRMLANAPTQDRERLKVVAEWVGHLRKDRPKLTNAHETELFNYLITEGNYNKAVTNYADLLKRIDTAIIKNTDDGKFDPSKALNLKKNIVADTSERAYIEELARLKKIWDDAEATVKNKLAEWRNRQKYDTTITDKEILDKIEKYKQYATLAKADYYAFLQKKNQYINADKNQQSLFGQTASDTLYNNLSILDTRGMSPTYQILPSYDQFFTPAEHKNSFAGFGLDDTKQLIADICRKHYKECAGIAAHLKGKTLLQSCFNLWHWLHHNIRYEYDRDGREEVRTPLRVWADRKRGVDCDCLSVFAWCVLKCMGYNPVFELVAFNGKKNLSHIFINCDGVVVDRVWFVFNQRPPRVTKREIYEVKLLQNLGQLF